MSLVAESEESALAAFHKLQQRVFIRWVNMHIKPFNLECTNFTSDWRSGEILAALIESLVGKPVNVKTRKGPAASG